MDLHDAALVIAGIVGSTVAIVHGVVTQRVMVRPVHELTAGKLPQSIRRLVAALLHFSTFNWFVSGLALLIAVYSFGREARLATCLLVGSSYLYPALGNLWATRGRHVGWVLYTVAVLLIVYGLGSTAVETEYSTHDRDAVGLKLSAPDLRARAWRNYPPHMNI